MAQVSATPAAGIDDEDIGARIARLGLPLKPNVIGKTMMVANCPHVGECCYCNVYTTMLERPDMANIPDSPERVEPPPNQPTTNTNIWRDERRASTTTPRGSTRATIGSGASGSLTNGVPKSALGKKISLGQYASQKKDKANGIAQRESKSPTRGEKRPIERITPDAVSERKADRREDVRDTRSGRTENPPKRQRTPTPPPPPPAKEPPPPPPPVKEPPPPPPVKEPPPPPPPVEKPRPVAAHPRPPSSPPPQLSRSHLPEKFPPMMSPTLPAILEEALARERENKETTAKPLPPLSPTLPPVLEEALATLGESPKIIRSGPAAAKRETSVDDTITLKPSKAVTQAAGKSAKSSASTAAAATKKGAVSKATVSPTKATPSQHLKVPGEPKKQLSLKKVAAEAPAGRTKKREVSESPAKRASSPAVTAKSRSGGYDEPSEDDTSDTEPKLSKVVKFRFKHLKWRYEYLVKLTKNSKDKVAEPEKRPGPDVAGKSTGKRVREAEDRERTPVPKKLKAEKPLSEIKGDRERMASKSSTPAKGADLPPPLKKEKATTEKAAVRRTESRNGDTPLAKVNTGRMATPVPLKDTGRMATPVPVVKREGRPDDVRIEGRPRKVSTSQPPPQLDPAANAKVEAFNQEHLRYQDFGKRLKHEAEGKIQSDRVEKDERYAKLLLLDSVLCYIVAFLCEEEANMTRGMKLNMESWRSIMPYLRVVLGRCKDVPPLYGLGKLLEAVILQHLLALDTDRFEKTPLPDATPLTPETGIALTPNPHAAAGAGIQAREHFSYLKNQLIRSVRDTHAAWTEANSVMTVDELRRFKKTWDKRATRLVSDRHRIRQAGFYKSEFSLPLHVNSSLLEAVNFGCSLLAEWSAEAGLALWESKVKLKEPLK